ncbi:MAG: putative rane protein [Mycobacteriales bacterium]|jgi:putative membrane protein
MTTRRVAAIALAAIGFAVLAGALAPGGAGAAAPNQQDRSFLAAAHQSNLAEIAAGQAAQRKATTAAVRAHGQLFIADHTRLDANLRKVASALGVNLPGAPSAAQQAALAAVNAKSGAAFDRAWVDSQLTAHRAALAAGNTELAQGSDAQAKGVAAAAAPVVKNHLSMLAQTAGVPSGVDAGTGGQAATGPSTKVGWGLLAVAGIAGCTAMSLLWSRRRDAELPPA